MSLPPRPRFARLAFALGRRLRGVAPRRLGLSAPAVATEVRNDLAAALPSFEQSCVSVVARVEQLDRDSQALVAHCEQLLHIAQGRDEGENLAQTTIAVLSGPLHFVDECTRQHDDLVGLLRRCEDQTRRMLSVRRRMQETLAPLACMTFFFKIESAGLDEASRETFLNVTAEIDRMRALVDETFAQNAELLASTHATLARVRLRLEQDLTAQAKHIRTRRLEIDQAIQTLEGQLGATSASDAELHRRSRAIAADVGRIVQGLQFQDIVQQKCDHVLTALEECCQADPVSAQAVKLEALQLDGAATDLAAGHTAALASFTQITEHISLVHAGTRDLGAAEGLTPAADAMIRTLHSSLAEVHTIVGQLADLTRQTHEAVRPAGDLAGNLSSTLSELAMQIRLIALNAQIRSVQIGERTGLEVLAARTAEISREINDLSDESARDLVQLRAAIEAMLAAFGAIQQSGQEQISALTSARSTTEQKLQGVRDHARAAAQQITRLTTELSTSAQEAVAEVGAFPVLRDALSTASSRLLELAGELGHSPADTADFAASTQRYTMASERETYERLTGIAPAASASAPTILSATTAAVAATATAPDESSGSTPAAAAQAAPSSIELF